MLRKLSLIFFLACSSCASHNGPQITACTVRGVPITGTDGTVLPIGCDCYDERTKKSFFLTIEQCDKYVAMPIEDVKQIAQFCHIQ